MRAARSRATIHVPINEAQQGEEPERIGGLVFKEEGEGTKERKRRRKKARRERVRRKSLRLLRVLKGDATRRDTTHLFR